MALFLILVVCCSLSRGGISEWAGCVGTLPSRRVPFCDHCHRLPDEAHAHDNDGRLQIREEPSSCGFPESELHGPASGV